MKDGRRSTTIPRAAGPILAGTPNGPQDKRLSISECRRLIGADTGLSDAEVESLRDQMYSMADITVTEYVAQAGKRRRREVDEVADTIAFRAAAA